MELSKIEMNLGTSALATAAASLASFGSSYLFSAGAINPGMIAMWSTLAYFGFSFRSPVKANQIAVLDRFGKPIRIIKPGLAFAWQGIYNLTYLQTDVIQREFPAEPEKIWRKKEAMSEEDRKQGYRPPTMMTFREAIVEEDAARKLIGEQDYTVLDLKKLPLEIELPSGEKKSWREMDYTELDQLEQMEIDKGEKGCFYTFKPEVPKDGVARRMETDVSKVCTWRIEDGIAFIETMGSEDPIANANQQIEDMMVSVLSRLLPNISVSQANQNIGWVNAHLLLAIIKRTLSWGVRIENAYLKPIKSPEEVSDAQSKFASAQFTGAADRELAVQRGKGAAEAARDLVEQTLIGQAAGMKRLADDLEMTGEQVQSAEVARALAASGSTVVVGADGFSQLLGIAATAIPKKPAPEQKGANQE